VQDFYGPNALPVIKPILKESTISNNISKSIIKICYPLVKIMLMMRN